MTAVLGRRWGGTQFNFHTSAPAFTAHTVDANNDGWAYIFQAQSANPITHGGFRYGARNGTCPAYSLTLETVSTSTGFPSGTDAGGGSATLVNFTPPADTSWDGLWQWVQFTNSYTPTRGEFLALVCRGLTTDASNYSTFTTDLSNIAQVSSPVFPCAARLTAGSWARRAVTPVGGVRTASERYGHVIEEIYGTSTASTIGHRVAARFNIPGSGTYTVRGMKGTVRIGQAVGKAPLLKIWNSGGTVLQDVTLDSDIIVSNTNSAHMMLFDETSLATLSAGTEYRIGLEVADSTTGGVTMYGGHTGSADDQNAFPDGANCLLSTYDGSSWTDDDTTRLWIELILDDWTEPSASGAVIIGGRRSTMIGR